MLFHTLHFLQLLFRWTLLQTRWRSLLASPNSSCAKVSDSCPPRRFHTLGVKHGVKHHLHSAWVDFPQSVVSIDVRTSLLAILSQTSEHFSDSTRVPVCQQFACLNCSRRRDNFCLNILPLLLLVTGDAKSKEIFWFAPSGEKLTTNQQHISVVRTEDSSTLTIYNVNIDDAGIYKCVVSSEEGEVEATLNVQIFRKIPSVLPYGFLGWEKGSGGWGNHRGNAFWEENGPCEEAVLSVGD